MRILILLTVALLPILGSSWAAIASRDVTYSDSTSASPLTMHIHMVHLREYDLKEGKAVARYRFHNSGESPLRVTNVKPSCGCVAVRMKEQKTFQPNETGEVLPRSGHGRRIVRPA